MRVDYPSSYFSTHNFTFQAPREIITFEHHAGYYIPLRYVSVGALPADFEQAGLFTLRKRLALAASNKDGLKEAIRKYLEDDPAVNPIRDAVRHCYPLPRADEAILDWIEHVLQDQSRQESAGED